MATNDWDEIKRLAADFQRAQLSSTSHKLSERNCIEVVNKLIGLGLIDVIHTIDGKEYLTPNQLEREIRDELLVHGGRINLVDLQQIICVDLLHIETRVSELVHRDRFFTLVQGELLDKDYLDRIAEEINETLQEAGQVAIADIGKQFDLPNDFILLVIEARLDAIIYGQIDPITRGSLFTAAFIAHTIARIRGICSAVTRPIKLVQLAAQYGLSEKLFLNVLETLISSQRLSGSIQGGKEKANYIPEIYSKTQTDYVDSLLKQNNYIEYQSLNRIGISDARLYLKKRYAKRKDIIYLSTCCVSEIIVDQIDAAIEEALTNDSWIDVKPLVPTPLTNEDINQLLQSTLKGRNKSVEVFCETVIVSKMFVSKCKSVFDPVMKSKAINDIKMSPSLFADLTKKEKNMMTDCASGDGKQARKDERQKKAMIGHAQKGGGGRGARESATKKTKNKYKNRKGNEENEDDDDFAERATKKHELAFMSVEEIEEILQGNFEDVDYDLLHEIASHLLRFLAREYQEVAKSIFLETTLDSSGKKKCIQDQQEKINGLLINIKLFEKGLSLFEDDTLTWLSKHLLKTVATEVVNIIFEMVANENLMSLGEDEVFSLDTRLKLIKKLPEKWKVPLTKLNSSLTAKTLQEFHDHVHTILAPEYCDVVSKKTDKKKERQLLFNHRQSLLDQLERECEGAMALHLSAVILFQYHTNTLLHAPGRCVPSIVSYLQKHISPVDFNTLTSYQSLVIQQLTDKCQSQASMEKNVEEDERDEKRDEKKYVGVLLSEGLSKVKDVVKNMKKQQTQEGEGEEVHE